MIEVGIIDGIDESKGTVRVILPDQDDAVKEDIALFKSEQWFPEIGESVVCLFSSGNQGFCIGTYFNDEDAIYVANKDLIIKKLDDNLIITYDRRSKSLSILASNPITIEGNVVIKGDLHVTGVVT